MLARSSRAAKLIAITECTLSLVVSNLHHFLVLIFRILKSELKFYWMLWDENEEEGEGKEELNVHLESIKGCHISHFDSDWILGMHIQ